MPFNAKAFLGYSLMFAKLEMGKEILDWSDFFVMNFCYFQNLRKEDI